MGEKFPKRRSRIGGQYRQIQWKTPTRREMPAGVSWTRLLFFGMSNLESFVGRWFRSPRRCWLPWPRFGKECCMAQGRGCRAQAGLWQHDAALIGNSRRREEGMGTCTDRT